MGNQKNKDETIVIKREDAPDITVELSEYLDVLGSDVRLKILKLLESKPMDMETISHYLYEKYGKTSSRENTKKHIDKLLSVGLVMKQPGIRDERPVINYVLIPGTIETVMRTLSTIVKVDLKFELSSKVNQVLERFSEEFLQGFATVRVLCGVDDGREFLLKKNNIRIGRVDPDNKDKYDPENDVALSEEYQAVSRVWKPHARLILDNGQWYIEHCEGKNPTYLWDMELNKYKRERLRNGDIINLAKGEKGARLVFLLPKSKDKQVNES